MEGAIYLGLGLLVGLIGASLLLRKKSHSESESQELAERLARLDEKVSSKDESTREMLSEMKQDIYSYLKETGEASERSTRGMQERIRDFTESMTKLDQGVRNIHESVSDSAESMRSFQDIFKTPKLRGNWGESNLKFLLEQTYPVSRIREQHRFSSADEAVDFALVLPNDYLLPIDSKFPLEIFTAYSEATEADERNRRRTAFIAGIKKEIDSIASKYIKPEETTTDLALMYVPAEAIYYELMFGLREFELDEYAKRKKVILVSPNTLHLTLRVVEHWFRDMTVAEETREIIKRLGTVISDSEKLTESFGKLGKHLSNAQGAYEDAEKRVELLSGRVEKVLSLGEGKKEG